MDNPENRPARRKRLLTAMAAYGVIALTAGLTLEGKLQTAVWIVLAGCALKTWIASVKETSQ